MYTVPRKHRLRGPFYIRGCGKQICSWSARVGRDESVKESFEKNKKGILLMLAAAALACVGQLFWKLSAESGVWYMLLGFALYGLGAVFMLTAYRFGSVSVLQPMMSANYALSAVLGIFVLQEKISALKVIGIFVITTGVILVGGGDTQDDCRAQNKSELQNGSNVQNRIDAQKGNEILAGNDVQDGSEPQKSSDTQDVRYVYSSGGDKK